jgi:acyl-CoA synthetase (AMP-forming)/AMP-acid ligase II
VSADSSAENYALFIAEIPLLGQIYPHLGHESTADAFVPYPSPAARTSLDDVAMYLHSSGGFGLLSNSFFNRKFNLCTSGSTGFPKCIPETHRNLIHWAALGQLFFFDLALGVV